MILMVFHVDAWYALPLAWMAVGFSYIFMHAISLPAVTYYNSDVRHALGHFGHVEALADQAGICELYGLPVSQLRQRKPWMRQPKALEIPATDRGGWNIGNTWAEICESKTDRLVSSWRHH